MWNTPFAIPSMVSHRGFPQKGISSWKQVICLSRNTQNLGAVDKSTAALLCCVMIG